METEKGAEQRPLKIPTPSLVRMLSDTGLFMQLVKIKGFIGALMYFNDVDKDSQEGGDFVG